MVSVLMHFLPFVSLYQINGTDQHAAFINGTRLCVLVNQPKYDLNILGVESTLTEEIFA